MCWAFSIRSICISTRPHNHCNQLAKSLELPSVIDAAKVQRLSLRPEQPFSCSLIHAAVKSLKYASCTSDTTRSEMLTFEGATVRLPLSRFHHVTSTGLGSLGLLELVVLILGVGLDMSLESRVLEQSQILRVQITSPTKMKSAK